MASETVARILPIELLRKGERGVIHDLCGDETVVHRLSEMGLRPGVEFRMIRPGSPCIVYVGEHRLTVRLDPSLQILVDVQS
jgi:ferrous iron transport protein A